MLVLQHGDCRCGSDTAGRAALRTDTYKLPRRAQAMNFIVLSSGWISIRYDVKLTYG